MIQLLAHLHVKKIAWSLYLIFYLSFLLPLYSQAGMTEYRPVLPLPGPVLPLLPAADPVAVAKPAVVPVDKGSGQPDPAPVTVAQAPEIGGPGQPEMSSFKSVGANDMVNLFTGDFSYNIPLMDVGGYPVNIFYNGDVSMEQEASWVGLGWNINPGNINRNMRGVPDDFDGTDTLVQTQDMRPDITWGFRVGADFEEVGIKALDVKVSTGMSFNNRLGPAAEIGVKGGLTFKIAEKVKTEKAADGSDSSRMGAVANVGVSLDGTLNSRNGLTLSPSVSLLATAFHDGRNANIGFTASTAYNSRYGIRAMQLSEQMSFNARAVKVDYTRDKVPNIQFRSSSYSFLSSSSISFARPSYIPAIRMPVTNEAYSGHFQLGAGLFGQYPSLEAEVYKQTAEISSENRVQRKPLVGYLYYEKGMSNQDAVMDFTRFNDKEVTSSTPVISAPQYSYDVFSIQGEGTGGSVRAYRNDMGTVRDNYTSSKDKSLDIGADVGPLGHYGANANTVKTPTTIGAWDQGNKLGAALPFKAVNGNLPAVYFRNPGERTVLEDNQFDRIGGTDLVRFKLGGFGFNPTVEPQLEHFSGEGTITGVTTITNAVASTRTKRSQVVNFLTAGDASRVGLDPYIRTYSTSPMLSSSHYLSNYVDISRVSDYRKAHHISEIDVTEAGGRRYIYGLPVYNIVQRDYTFSVGNTGTSDDEVSVSDADWMTPSSGLLDKKSSRDGYVQISETPAYAHSFLLTGLLSPDYVDVTGDGISEDDLGTAVKFNYTRIKDANGNWAVHKWRTPLGEGDMAHFNEGNRSEDKDDKGIISYGERESWYLHSIESKAMIALFYLGNREDGKGPDDEHGGVDETDVSVKELDSIALYSKSDLKKNGLEGARPIKVVHFHYDYALCSGTPDNPTGLGKLTLDSITFTFNGQQKANNSKYIFAYGQNPAHSKNGSDRWGVYKPAAENPEGMKNSDYPYSLQDATQKTTIDANTAAWSLDKILLPSGGQIEVTYESDDYAFVQNRRAADMMSIAGFGGDNSTITSQLYSFSFSSSLASIGEHDYIFIHVPESCNDKDEVNLKYLQGLDQLAVKLMVKMPKGYEYLTVYANIADYGVYAADHSIIWIQVKKVDGYSPFSLTALEYLREQLPGQAFPGYDVSDDAGLAKVGDILAGMLNGLKNAFKDPVKALRSDGKAREVDVARSFARLNDPDGFKYGGGQRVKAIRLKDNWNAMTEQYTSVYGQEYTYTTTALFAGEEKTISSGVTSYEPSIGGEENPFHNIVQVADKLPLGPASYGSVEMPVLDAFFPAPVVGYSKVTVRSINSVTVPQDQKSRSGVGKQVTEFYTAKDYPVYYAHTALDPLSDLKAHANSLFNFFHKYSFDSRALSQGFLVATNDMHGQLKSQTSYAENDEQTPVQYTRNYYRNTGEKGLDEKFDFVDATAGGKITPGNMGIDIELMTDTREFSVKSHSKEIQGQVDLFPVFLPFWLPFIWPVNGESENTYRAVTTTKVISYHSVVDSVVVMDKGSVVSTRNLVYDAQTGSVVVTRTNNEFEQPVYNVSYPAYWAYSGMGPAYQNIDATFSGISFYDGKITTPNFDESIFESGDELLVTSQGEDPDGCLGSGTIYKLWAYDKHKNETALTVADKDLVFMDATGNLFSKTNVSLRIVRSGKRNMLDAQVASITCMANPIVIQNSSDWLLVDANSKVAAAGAMEYKEKWQTDNDNIKRYSVDYCSGEYIDCNGYLEKKINPYRKGLIGNFRSDRSFVFYGDREQKDLATTADKETNLPQDGFLAGFTPYWSFNTSSNLVPDTENSKWVWNERITRVNARGMELETQNALGIYTGAQYAYDKNLPVAITTNSRYEDMAYDGFEDDGFDGSLDNQVSNSCFKKHVDYSSMSNSSIVNTDTLSFGAHTGRFALSVNANSTASKTFDIEPSQSDSFSLILFPDTTQVMANPGENIEYVEVVPIHGYDSVHDYVQSWLCDSTQKRLMNFEPPDTTYPWGARSHTAVIRTGSYFEVPEADWYYMQINLSETWIDFPDVDPSWNFTVNATIFDSSGTDQIAQLNLTDLYLNASGGNANTHVYLCKGIYKLRMAYMSQIGANSYYRAYSDYYCSISPVLKTYKTLTKVNGCPYTHPIEATDSMINPVYHLSADTTMLFSAWVRESCGDLSNGIPCGDSTYTHNQVNINFNSGSSNVTLVPTGPVIDGWQRYEGTFIPPEGATTMTLQLVNSSSNPIYFDDIRMHPYHGNMKSYVYDPVSLRLVAELDENNYASFYEYDEEGTLIRTKAETREGIKTIQETRSAKQTNINALQ